MDEFRTNLYCGCCTLRTESLIIGTLGSLMTVLQIFYVTSPLKAETRKYENTQNDIAAEIAYCAVTLLVCFLMIVGVYKNNKRLILPWLVLKCMECIAWSIITFIVFVLFFFVEAKLVMILLFFYTVFFTTLNWYFWICVWSLYMELPEKHQTTVIPLEEVKSKDTEYCPVAAV